MFRFLFPCRKANERSAASVRRPMLRQLEWPPAEDGSRSALLVRDITGALKELMMVRETTCGCISKESKYGGSREKRQQETQQILLFLFHEQRK